MTVPKAIAEVLDRFKSYSPNSGCLPSMQQQVERLGFESGSFHRLHWDEGSHALRQLVSGTAVWHVD